MSTISHPQRREKDAEQAARIRRKKLAEAESEMELLRGVAVGNFDDRFVLDYLHARFGEIDSIDFWLEQQHNSIAVTLSAAFNYLVPNVIEKLCLMHGGKWVCRFPASGADQPHHL